MSLTALHKIGVIVTPDGQLNQLTARNIDPRITRLMLRGDGKVSPQFIATMAQDPIASVTTTAVKRFLDMISASGKGYTAATDFYIQKKTFGGTFAGALNHAKVTAPYSLFVPRRLSARHGAEATIEFDVFFISADGLAAAMTYTGSISLPAITASDQAYTLGPGSINSSALGGLMSLDIDFGLTPNIKACAGEIFPTFACFDGRSPTIRVTTYDPTILNTIAPPTGAAQGATPSKVFLRQKSNEGGNVPDATVSHLKFEITTLGVYDPGVLQESDEGDSMLEVIWSPGDDGVNDILIYGGASAIS